MSIRFIYANDEEKMITVKTSTYQLLKNTYIPYIILEIILLKHENIR